ncbi:acyltransferase [uncultured Clostridium sp.]|uniref:acyltransferase n=1 Tax=uncultured Clostridium sp. TaxID=59620 RepID=UPI0028E5304B|nr:acyltransferase [uncultured Clostridium sp.]
MDIGKAYATLAVIMIHISAFAISSSDIGSSNYKIFIVLNQLSRFSVPVFVIFSGIGLGLSYRKEKSILNFYKKRVFKVIPPYILWGIIYLTLINKNFNYSQWPNLFLKGDKIFYHLYFLPMIIELYLIFPVLYIVSQKIWGVVLSLIISGGIITTAHYYNIPDLTLDFYSKRNIIFWLFYFSLGIYFSGNIKPSIEKFKRNKTFIAGILLLCITGLLWESFNSIAHGKSLDYATTFIRPSVIIYSIVFTAYILSRDYKERLGINILKSISINSFDIYFSHPLVIYYYMKVFKYYKIHIGSIEFILSSIILCTILPILINSGTKAIYSMILNKKKKD